MEKSPEAFRTIREVAEAMDLPQHVLRFWETRFPQIRPLKRAGGRRYYRPDDVEKLRLIRRLLYEEGYTIKGVQKLFKEQGAQALASGGFGPQTALIAREPVGPTDWPRRCRSPRRFIWNPASQPAEQGVTRGPPKGSGLEANDLAALQDALVGAPAGRAGSHAGPSPRDLIRAPLRNYRVRAHCQRP